MCSAGMSRTGAHIRLHLHEFPTLVVCDIRLNVGCLRVLRNFLKNTVVHSGKAVLPMLDVEVVVFGGVEVELFGIVDVKVDTTDR